MNDKLKDKSEIKIDDVDKADLISKKPPRDD
jgi:hypothetical protein